MAKLKRAADTGVTRNSGKGLAPTPVGSPAGTARVIRAVTEIILLIVRAILWVGFTAAGVALNTWSAAGLLLLLTPGTIWGYAGLAFGAAIAGCAGGAIMAMGQVLALRRWLDGVASVASFLSTVLASSAALATGTVSGWWTYTTVDDVAGMLAGLVVYGTVFGFIQRPMVDYMAERSLLWVPVNAASALLGVFAMLAAFDVSGGRRDTLQFRYVGIVYAIVTGVAFLWMTRRTRAVMAIQRSRTYAAGRDQGFDPNSDPDNYPGDLSNDTYEPGVLEIHEHRLYRVRGVRKVPRMPSDAKIGTAGDVRTDSSASSGGQGVAGPGEEPDVIDTTFMVVP